ncbi:hypothetical protein DUF876 [Psychromonas ingrahamii 37]|uniref:Type VI secretion protein, VC_A0114 family n=1 Tax=Psychromonas ingrahamii (strain DSM 17664 / CCUG 51855 / 37) TaxID=357804 RepID=A1SQX5_PSYIN|nr:type VI secretion system baseplate subunit TssK [Psychromonas ingrahamii]ABM01890.1 hypothetical protein DUF876 [Psychromonas ingrahamii 37]
MDSMKSIYWNQGLFLKPQHFQQLDRYTSTMSNLYSKVRSGVESGISELKFDLSALKTGLLVIEKLECILEDGSLLLYPGNCQIPPLRLDKEQFDDSGNLNIFIALAPISAEQNNLVSNSSPDARFKLAADINKKDLFDNNEQATLSMLDFNCNLVPSYNLKSTAGLSLLKVAEIFLSVDQCTPSETFIPKITLLSGSEVLKNLVKSTKQSLVGRFEQLQNITSFESGLVNSSNNLSVGLAMMSISNHIATFIQFEENPSTQVSDIYLAYRQLISQLSMFSTEVSVIGETLTEENSIIPFNQNNLSDCFSKVNNLTTKLLNELTVQPELLVNLIYQGDSKFVAQLSREFLDPGYRIYLRIRTKENVIDHLDNILNFLKVGADGQVDVYLKRALPGVQLSYLDKKPQGVATVPNSYYFGLDRQSFQWQKVIELSRIGVIWSDYIEDVALDLIAVQG